MKLECFIRFVYALALLLSGCFQVPQEAGSPTLDSSFEEYRIYYLSSASIPGLLSPIYIQGAIGAESATSWAQIVAANDNQALDAVIIYSSAISQIEPAELTAMYDNGIVMVFFNVYSPIVDGLVDDSEIGSGDWMDGTAEPMDGDFYLMARHLTLCSNGQVFPPACPGYSQIASGYKSKAANSLNSEADFEIFRKVLLSYLENSTQP